MANKKKTGLIIGLAAGGVALYLLTRKATTPAPATTMILPSAPTAAAAASGSGNILSTLANLGKSIFGGSSSPAAGSSGAFTPVAVAPAAPSTGISPATGITYINPTAPTLQLPPASSGDVSSTDDGILSDFTFSGVRHRLGCCGHGDLFV